MSDIIQRAQYLYRRLYGVAGARKVRYVQQIFLYCHQKSAPGPILSVQRKIRTHLDLLSIMGGEMSKRLGGIKGCK